MASTCEYEIDPIIGVNERWDGPLELRDGQPLDAVLGGGWR